MDVLNMLSKEINDRHLNEDEAIRFIYLKLCELFSFDERWYYTNLFNDQKTHREILNRQYDLGNVTDFKTICHTFTPLILERILEELLDREVEIIESSSHTYAISEFNGEEYILDATNFYDLTRVKMGIKTRGFKPLMYSQTDDKHLEEIDESLGYHLLDNELYKKKIAMDDTLSISDKKINIAKLLELSKCKYSFADARCFIKIIDELYGIDEEQEDETFVDSSYNYHKVYRIYPECTYFNLSKIDDEYRLEEIPKEKCLKIVSGLEAKNKIKFIDRVTHYG